MMMMMMLVVVVVVVVVVVDGDCDEMMVVLHYEYYLQESQSISTGCIVGRSSAASMTVKISMAFRHCFLRQTQESSKKTACYLKPSKRKPMEHDA